MHTCACVVYLASIRSSYASFLILCRRGDTTGEAYGGGPDGGCSLSRMVKILLLVPLAKNDENIYMTNSIVSMSLHCSE